MSGTRDHSATGSGTRRVANQPLGRLAARWRRCALGIGALAAAWFIARALLPAGLPFGVVLMGLVLGSLTSLTSVGLVLVYRAARVINFAQVAMGGLAAALAVVLVTGAHVPYLAALPLGLLAAAATGATVEKTVVRRFFRAPRLIVTVTTIGVAQVLGAAEVVLPHLFSHLSPVTTFTTPFDSTFRVGPIVFNGNDMLAIGCVPLALLGLWWFLGRSDTGVAIRASADSDERATLLGIPVRRLSLATWTIAAVLSGVGSVLAAPIVGPQLGVISGPTTLLAPLAAAVVGGMESLPIAVGASLGIGVFEQAVFWSYPQSSSVDVALFALVIGALLVRRRRQTRGANSTLGGFVAFREVRPIPAALRRLPEVRWVRASTLVLLGIAVIVLPALLPPSTVVLVAFMAIYGILAVSLVVLTGWAGQISLGQFAFAGVGAATTGALMVHAGADLFVALLASAGVGAVAAILIGLPALRVQGLFLAVATLAFAVPVSSYLLNASNFPTLTPSVVPRPELFGRISLGTPLTFYWFCLAFLAAAYLVARNFRRSRAGRVVVAVRDNERCAAAFGVHPHRARITAFALSGALAGIAGGLYVIGLRGIGFSGFAPEKSVVIFTMVVVGGLGSLPGALLGAIYVESATYFLSGAAQLVATGGGLLVLLMVVPGGLGEIVFAIRDRLLASVARRHGLVVDPALEPVARRDERLLSDIPEETAGTRSDGVPSDFPHDPRDKDGAVASHDDGADLRSQGTVSLLSCQGIEARYGLVRVLFGVDIDVAASEVLALLGTNGAGKSSVLKVLAGLLPAEHGRILFDGMDITSMDPARRVAAGLVLAPGGHGVFGSLTVSENLRMASWLRRRDRSQVHHDLAGVLERFPALAHRMGTQAANLSGGEQQMLTIAMALLCHPRLLMIDELSLGLAPNVVAELLGVVRSLARDGTTIVVVEQSLNVAAALAPRAVFMERGRVHYRGPTADLVDRPDLARAVFLRSTASPPRTTPSEPRDITGPSSSQAIASRGRPSQRLQIRELRYRYGGLSALDGVTLGAAAGEIVGIIGANGAGKTTLFDACSGFVLPGSGQVLLDGVDVTTAPPALRAGLGLGRMFQDARLFPSLTVAEALAVAFDRHVSVRDPLACTLGFGAALDSEAALEEEVDELIATMGLERYRDSFIGELSTGTRRIVELAGAVAHRPRVLLLDEPSSGVAQRETEALGALLLDVRARTGATLVLIEHDIPLITSIADRLVCMHLGSVIAEGRPDDVVRSAAVVRAYLGADDVAIARSGGATVDPGVQATAPSARLVH